ncbi:hypothetical protein [Phaeocystidibacter luteus]|uniref:Uncharacterized protein n=1 Tax=Phaeocystidibacter luteus TaxID=911197 RepID=A0A6N6RKV0_9FLAO|nr:hypothetical protein [Phaeocystidibacter luteus]KAB2813929.1 hypothetical protein F8C67_04385 [Phaeocystidibacter luteus]
MRLSALLLSALILCSCTETSNSTDVEHNTWTTSNQYELDSFIGTTGSLNATLLYVWDSDEEEIRESNDLFTLQNVSLLNRVSEVMIKNDKLYYIKGDLQLELTSNGVIECEKDTGGGRQLETLKFGSMELGSMDTTLNTFDSDTIYEWSESMFNGMLSIKSQSCCCVHKGHHEVRFVNDHGTFRLLGNKFTFEIFEDPISSDLIVIQYSYCDLKFVALRIQDSSNG